jgi:hypothetical protein
VPLKNSCRLSYELWSLKRWCNGAIAKRLATTIRASHVLSRLALIPVEHHSLLARSSSMRGGAAFAAGFLIAEVETS